MANPFVGEIRLFGFPRIPTGWFACDGSLQSIAQYEVLYTLIGTTFGGDGINTFGLPDLRGRIPISQGNGTGGLTPRVLGEVGGEPEHQLLIAEIPSHSHPLTSTTNVGSTATPSNTVHLATVSPNTARLYAPASSVTTSSVMAPCVNSAGNSLPHPNMMPTLTGNFCICWAGVFPSQG
jgi:microcystin-dependent protein